MNKLVCALLVVCVALAAASPAPLRVRDSPHDGSGSPNSPNSPNSPRRTTKTRATKTTTTTALPTRPPQCRDRCASNSNCAPCAVCAVGVRTGNDLEVFSSSGVSQFLTLIARPSNNNGKPIRALVRSQDVNTNVAAPRLFIKVCRERCVLQRCLALWLQNMCVAVQSSWVEVRPASGAWPTAGSWDAVAPALNTAVNQALSANCN